MRIMITSLVLAFALSLPMLSFAGNNGGDNGGQEGNSNGKVSKRENQRSFEIKRDVILSGGAEGN